MIWDRRMMRLIRIATIVASTLLPTATAQADPGGATGGGFTNILLDLVQLAFALGCLLLALRVFSMVRGGKIAAGWRFLALGFALFGLAQLGAMGYRLELASFSFYWISVARALALALMLVGVSRIRRILT